MPYLVAPWKHPHPWDSRLIITYPPHTATKEERKAHVLLAEGRIRSSGANASIVSFTDGSKRIALGCRKVGAGVCILRDGIEIAADRLSLGPRSDVFDAEMAALAMAATRAESLVVPTTPAVLFFADNIAAVQQIVSLKPHPAQVYSILFRKAIDQLLLAYPNLAVEIWWIPGHAGIAGNERADVLASEAGNITPTPLYNRSVTWALARAKSRAIKLWVNRWRSLDHSETVRTHITHLPSWQLNPFHNSFSGRRAIHSRLIQVILGHGFFGAYFLRFVPTNDIGCQCDHSKLQTAHHILYECPLHDDARMIIRKASRRLSPSHLFGSVPGLTALASFLASSSAFRPLSNCL